MFGGIKIFFKPFDEIYKENLQYRKHFIQDLKSTNYYPLVDLVSFRSQ